MNPYSMLPPVPDSLESFAINGYLLWDRVIEPLVEKMKQAAIEVEVETPDEGVKTIRISGTVEGYSGEKQSIEIFKLEGENETKMEFSFRKLPQEEEESTEGESETPDEAG